MKSIKSIAVPSQSEYLVDKSRFICDLAPIQDASEAALFLENIKQLHPKANHHCYAYILGVNSEVQKFTDDGEPGGTAGMPMLNILKHEQLTNLLAIVTRYFGGIKLGTGGLARAYSQAVKLALANNDYTQKTEKHLIQFELDYLYLASIKYLLANSYQARIADIDYQEQVKLSCYLANEQLADFQNSINQICSQQLSLTDLGSYYI